jgi:hypothetical protein
MMYDEIRQQSTVGTIDKMLNSSWNVMFVPGRFAAVSSRGQHRYHV